MRVNRESFTVVEGAEQGRAQLRQAHIPALDGLRGFAAAVVVFAHIRADADIGVVHQQIGTYGVLLFFILSGFLMGHLYLRQPFDYSHLSHYLASRISRVVPLYYAVGIVSFFISRIDGNFPYYMNNVDAVRHILMIDNVSVFWTIAPEFQFYFIFPVLWWLVYQPSKIRVPFGFLAAFLVAVLFVFRYQLPGLLIISKLHVFLLGVGIAAIRPFIQSFVSTLSATVLQVLAVGILFSLVIPPTIAFYQWLYLDGVPDRLSRFYYEPARTIMIGYCVFAFSIADTPFSRVLFGNRCGRALGRYSFSLYLLHTPVIYFVTESTLPYYLSGSATIACIVALSLVLSAFSYYCFELPLQSAAKARLIKLFGSVRQRTLRVS